MNCLLSTSLLEGQAVFLKSSLIILYLILAALALSCIVFTFIMLRSHMEGIAPKFLMVMLFLVTAFVLVCTVVCTTQYNRLANTKEPEPSSQSTITEPSTEEVPSTTEPVISTAWNVKWEIMQNSTVLNSYIHPNQITFGDTSTYTQLEGITTFRGNHYRDSASYGYANIINQTITQNWQSTTGTLNEKTGSGWTGQPLIVRWDDASKANMNLFDEKKAKADLVEVIYATLDGNIYFYDLDDGTYTRDPIQIGMNFKGTGTLDPRGYPLLYIGSDASPDKSARMYIISLIDGSIVYEKAGSDIDAYYRQFAFNTAPIIHAETDTLIWPAESGILYFVKLNTVYEQESAIISVKPENLIKLRYNTDLSRNVGTDASIVTNEKYLYYADNGGMVFCVDLETMLPVWSQDTHDKVCATPVLQKHDQQTYLYTATTLFYETGTSYIQKLDAATGDILWEYTLTNVSSGNSVPGGALASPILGKAGSTIDGLIIYNIARTPTADAGLLIALDCETGELVWEHQLPNYSWSSPLALYTEDNTAYFVLCDSQGNVELYDGATGTVLHTVSINSGIDASPAAFENTFVVGSLNGKVYGFEVE